MLRRVQRARPPLLNSTSSHKSRCPISSRELLHANNACRARRVDELVAADGNADMRGSAAHGREEQQISRRHVSQIDLGSSLVLIANVAREADAVLRKHPLHQAAAVEPRRIAAAVPVRNPSQHHRGRDDSGGRQGRGWHDNRRLGSAGKRTRSRDAPGSGARPPGEGRHEQERRPKALVPNEVEQTQRQVL